MGLLAAIPKLADLVTDPGKITALPSEAIPSIRGELAKLDTLLLSRLLSRDSGQVATDSEGDRLLDAKQAAAMLHSSTDYLYRHSSKLPFTVRMGRKVLFSESGITRYIRARMGR